VKKEVFEDWRVLESYCQAVVTVLRETCRTFRRHFLQIGNVEVFLESLTVLYALLFKVLSHSISCIDYW
jgi:hypothetical protein